MSTDTKEPEVTTEETHEQPTAYTKAEQKHYQDIREMEARVGELEIAMERTKSQASAAKKAFEAAVEKAREFTRSGLELQQSLPGMDAEAKDAWKDFPVNRLLLPDALTQQVFDADLESIGALSHYIAENGEQWWRDLPGIGEVKATEIAEAFVAFWQAYPEFCGSIDSEPDDDEEDDDDDECKDD